MDYSPSFESMGNREELSFEQEEYSVHDRLSDIQRKRQVAEHNSTMNCN